MCPGTFAHNSIERQCGGGDDDDDNDEDDNDDDDDDVTYAIKLVAFIT